MSTSNPIAGPSSSSASYYSSPNKYQENGHDTFSDFVTLVCQEAQNSNSSSQQNSGNQVPLRTQTKLPQFYPSSMLPPPPPPPMARPVAIIRSTASECGELNATTANSPTSATITVSNASSDATSNGSTRRENGVRDSTNTPPVTPSTSADETPVSRPVLSGSFSGSGRSEYAFTHIHPQPAQLFTYPSMSGVSGVISPTNLSLFTSPVTTPRTTPRSTPIPRWSAPFISLDENMDYSMMAGLMPGANPDEPPPLLGEERFFGHVVHSNESMDASGQTTSSNNASNTPTKS
uniref:Uncharacterized protein n=1 Tax=Strigamia maritima TaxID=126957 RepID=T1JCU1_STRMM